MEQAKFCDGCRQANDCKIMYEQLGHVDSPPVALKAVGAFVVPVIVFAGALAVFGALLRHRVTSLYQTPLACVLALGITAGFMLTGRAVVRRLHKLR